MRILIVRNNSNPQTLDASLLLDAYLASQGIDCDRLDIDQIDRVFAGLGHAQAAHYDMAVTLGGDGTLLRTARFVGTHGVPILGMNFGNLGFLVNPVEEGVVPLMAAALAGDVTEERRASLCLRYQCDGEDEAVLFGAPAPVFADGEGFGAEAIGAGAAVKAAGAQAAGVCNTSAHCEGTHDSPRHPYEEGTLGAHLVAADDEPEQLQVAPREFFALNEVEISRGTFGHIIDFNVEVDGAHVAHMRGDGLLVASATGSTAYALSAGGPLVSPSYQGLVVVPLAPHTLQSRALITAPQEIVEVALDESFANEQARLFIDGSPLKTPAPIRRLVVSRNSEPTVLLRYKAPSFYEHVANTFF